MFNSDILDIAIGLVFVYLLLSLICSVVNEWIATVLSMRARNLEAGIRNLLEHSTEGAADEPSLTERVYNHGMIAGLFKKDMLDRLFNKPGSPSYIPSRTFALALLDTIAPTDMSTPQAVADVRQAIDNLPEGHAREALLALVNNAQNDMQKLQQNIENWYNDAMDRVSGWYKRKTQIIIICLALVIAIISNADTVAIVKSLQHNPALRASALAAAQEHVKNSNSNSNSADPLGRIKGIEKELEPLHLPLGWVSRAPETEGDPRTFPNNPWDGLIKVLGLLLTAVALSLGAPFWFDVLNKFIVIRSTIKPREKSRDEGSKDNTTEVQAMQNLLEADTVKGPALGAGASLLAGSASLSMAAVAPPVLAPALAPVLTGEAARSATDLLNLARPHIGEDYILGSLVPMNNPNWRGPWDCAEFVSWCVYQLIGKLYGCRDDGDDPAHTDAYTGWWGRDANTVARRITVREAANTPGALLLRLPQPHMNGHIVICDGQGGTIEAASHLVGVIAGHVDGRRWDMGILVPEINYPEGGGGIIVNPPQVVYRLTSPYMSGSGVLEVQQRLLAHGVDPGGLDGKYGPKTAAAVYSFQVREGLIADGEAGPQTIAALRENIPATPAQHYPGLDMGGYPGDNLMRAIFADPYVFTGYYLNSPCHRDKPVGHWEPWMGHWRTLKEIGWGLVVVYVGQQMSGASPCHQNTLSRSQGEVDGDDAIAKAMTDELAPGVIIFLDIEAMDQVPAGMLSYLSGWVGRLLDDGHYKPGIYCHHKNADVLFNAAQHEYATRGIQDESPAFWIVKIKNSFDVVNDSPADSGVPYARVWQGRIGVSSEQHGQVTIASLDHDVATTANPSNV